MIRRRASILAIAVVLGVAGGAALLAARPGSPAVADASPTPSPKPTPFPIPTPRYTMPPAGSRCPTLNQIYDAPDAYIEFTTAAGFGEPLTVAVGRTPLLVPFRPPAPGDRGGGDGFLLGARIQEWDVGVHYETAEYLRESARVTAVEAMLELPGGGQARLRTTVPGADGRIALDGVPDVDAESILHVRIRWIDQCYEYAAEARMAVRVVSAASVAGCAAGEAAWQQLGALLGPPLAFGNAEANLGLLHGSSPLIEMPIIDGPYPAIMYDRAGRSATARPGEVVAFHSTNPELILTAHEDRPNVEFYARDAVIRHIDAGTAYAGDAIPPVVFTSRIEARDGEFIVRAPDVPGRYVAALSLGFTSKCFLGEVGAGAGLDVVAG